MSAALGLRTAGHQLALTHAGDAANHNKVVKGNLVDSKYHPFS